MKLKDSVIILTGAGRGLGKAIALALADREVKLALLARTRHELDAVAEVVSAAGSQALVVPVDLSDPDQIEGAVAKTLEAFGGIDVLINNAGWSPPLRPLQETTLETWNTAMDVNARATFLLCKACLPTLIEKRAGHIINISTAVVDVPVATITAYRASKAAQKAFAESLLEEVRPLGIKVTTILPEPMDTPMRWEATPDYPRDRVMDPNEVARVVVELLKQNEEVFVDRLAVRVV
ncbi:MAG: SDR family oxidoreductase [Trueperaceae bacterium]|nr:MAG: SDR family oxidoreductase [Trueperaceae bacterium]